MLHRLFERRRRGRSRSGSAGDRCRPRKLQQQHGTFIHATWKFAGTFDAALYICRTSRGSADRFRQISLAFITVKSRRSSISHISSARGTRNLIQTILEASIQKFRYFSLLGEGYLTTFTLFSWPSGVPKWSVVFCRPCKLPWSILYDQWKKALSYDPLDECPFQSVG